MRPSLFDQAAATVATREGVDGMTDWLERNSTKWWAYAIEIAAVLLLLGTLIHMGLAR